MGERGSPAHPVDDTLQRSGNHASGRPPGAGGSPCDNPPVKGIGPGHPDPRSPRGCPRGARETIPAASAAVSGGPSPPGRRPRIRPLRRLRQRRRSRGRPTRSRHRRRPSRRRGRPLWRSRRSRRPRPRARPRGRRFPRNGSGRRSPPVVPPAPERPRHRRRAPPPTSPSATSSFPFVVTDRKGRPVPDLKEKDVTLLSDGVPVAWDLFQGSADAPVSYAVLLDGSGSMGLAGKMEGARAAIEALAATPRPGGRLRPLRLRRGRGEGGRPVHRGRREARRRRPGR